MTVSKFARAFPELSAALITVAALAPFAVAWLLWRRGRRAPGGPPSYPRCLGSVFLVVGLLVGPSALALAVARLCGGR